MGNNSLLVENAMAFKEEILRKNSKNMMILNLQSMRLGINSVISLSNSLQNKKVGKE